MPRFPLASAITIARIPRTLLLLLSVIILPATLAHAQNGERAIERGIAVHDSLTTPDAHVFTMELDARQFVFGSVDQKTVDVVVVVHDPEGREIARFDGPARGPEHYRFTTETAGAHRLEVRPFEEGRGEYVLRLQRVEPVASTPEGQVDQLMAAYTDDGTPGAVISVLRDGETVFARAYGAADLTFGVPFDLETPSNIGSTSKQFTAFALVLLAERGMLSLDDDIRTHIPELPDFGQTITLRHLLTHTSGYREVFNTLAMAGIRFGEGDYIDRSAMVDLVKRQPTLQNDPGAEFNYNNTGFGLLTLVVERVAKQPFPEWMRENVFLPLGMTKTMVRESPHQIVPRGARGYAPAEGGGFRELTDLSAAMGAGGIYTTAADMLRWMRNLHDPVVGSADVIEAMTTRFVLTTGDTTGYGLGLFIDEQGGLRRVQHGGADNAHRAMMMYFPEIDAGVFAMSNHAAFSPGTVNRIAEIFFADAMSLEETPVTKLVEADGGAFDPDNYDAASFDALAGAYELEVAPGFILNFFREGATLYTQATGQSKIEIRPTSDSTFALTVVEAGVTFHRGPDGSADSLTLHQNGSHMARRVQQQPWDPTGEELAAFTGRYFSEELETYYEVATEEESLVVHHRRMDDMKLSPTKQDAFTGRFPLAEIAFLRDDSGEVTALKVSNGRARGIRFDRVD